MIKKDALDEQGDDKMRQNGSYRTSLRELFMRRSDSVRLNLFLSPFKQIKIINIKYIYI